jgi:hypothetical protein
LQYIQIAESVLSKLPSNLQLPETRTTQELRESRISTTEMDNEENDNEENMGIEKATDETDEDLV